jgi:hypothetical protein
MGRRSSPGPGRTVAVPRREETPGLDQELMVICNTGIEPLRIVEIYLPSWKVAVLTGIDSEKTVSRFLSPVESLQLLCKPVPATGPKPLRIRIVAPKA